MISLTSSTPVYLAHSTFLLKYPTTCFGGFCYIWIGPFVPTAEAHLPFSGAGFFLLLILLLSSKSMLSPPQTCSTFRTSRREMMIVCITYPALDFFQFIISCVLESSLCRTLGTYFCLSKQKLGYPENSRT